MHGALRLPAATQSVLTRHSPLASHSKITGDKLLTIFRKIGTRFTLRDRDTLMKHMDPSGDGSCSFKEFALAFSSVDRSKLGGLATVFKCGTHACCATTID